VRTSIVYNTETRHLKLIGNLYDNCQEALVQYAEFLHTTVTEPEEYMRLMPSLATLAHDYKLEPEVSPPCTTTPTRRAPHLLFAPSWNRFALLHGDANL
jgi:hypothetical protein